MSAAIEVQPPIGKDSVKFLVIGDTGTGDRAQIEVGAQMWKAHARVPVRVRDHARRQHVRLGAAAGLRREVRAPVQAAARRQDRVLRVARQSRRSRTSASTRTSTWTASATTPIRRRTCAFFALDSNYMDQDQQRWLEEELTQLELEVEDRLLPPPALFVGRPARLGSRPARASRAAVHQVRPQRGLCRPRALLRAAQAAEGHPLLHRRRLRQAARRRHHRQRRR